MVHIRPATREDTGLILHFFRELTIYEKVGHEVLATGQDIREQSSRAIDSPVTP